MARRTGNFVSATKEQKAKIGAGREEFRKRARVLRTGAKRKPCQIGKEQFENSQQRLAGSKNLPLARGEISGKLIKLYSQLWRTRENSPKLS